MFIARRSPRNPLLMPSDARPWEARGTFNGCPIKKGGSTYLLYRALGNPDALMTPAGISTIGVAESQDGESFSRRRQLITPSEEWDRFGCEDPRVAYFEGTYIIFYTALGGVPFGAGNIKIGVALSRDLEHIDEKHLVTPFNAKAMALFPKRVGGKITAVLTAHTDEPPARIAIVQCDRLEELWDQKFWEAWHADLSMHTLNPLRSDHDHVEVGAPPIRTKDGWLLIYSYIQNYFGGGERVFGIEAVLLDLDDPRTIIGRTKGPILVPEEIYERYGVTPDIVFPTGALLEEEDRLDVYYGSADTVCAKFSLSLNDLLTALIPMRRAKFAIRAKENPIIRPDANHSWEKKATFNPAAVQIGGTVHILYRAMSNDNTSTFGYASSKDGVHISKRLPEPAYAPRADFEMKRAAGVNSGCEDPRLTRIGERIYLGYTAYDGVHPWHAALSSIAVKDFVAQRFSKWSPPQLVTPDMVHDKDMCVFPEKIGNKFMLMHRVDTAGSVCADLLDSLDFSKERLSRCIELISPRKGMWDSEKVGIAGPPLKTKAGWLLIYHGVSRTGTYRLGAALLDLKNPTIVLARTADTIFEPTESYELEGQVRKVVFSCGMTLKKDSLFVYYGAADSVVGVATFSLKRLLSILAPKTLT
ncbi:MAG: hypothetical protein KGJ34_00270 [Patescibacteria group bacterium]|nr:hypothetical protein [Patescibacteria group bacterium]